MAEKRTVRYIGDGAFLIAVPARDLTWEEWLEHKTAILASPHAELLYELPKSHGVAVAGAVEEKEPRNG